MEYATKEQLQEWVRQLRSSKFRQGKHRLCDTDESGNTVYCCLGVAQHLFNLEVAEDEELLVQKEDDFSRYFTFLPEHVQSVLSTLNDNDANFYRIANIVEDKIIPKLPDWDAIEVEFKLIREYLQALT